MSCPHHRYEQELAEIAAEIPNLIADLQEVAEERRHDGHGAQAAKIELLIVSSRPYKKPSLIPSHPPSVPTEVVPGSTRRGQPGAVLA